MDREEGSEVVIKVMQYMRYEIDGVDGHLDVPWDVEIPWHKAFVAAHQNADGARPTPEQCDDDLGLWEFAIRIRDAEDELLQRSTNPEVVREFLRGKAVAIACAAAKANPPSYYTGEDFEPHAWVVDAIMTAASRR